MNDVLAKLEAVFTEDFINENNAIETMDELYAAVSAKEISISREDFDTYADILTRVYVKKELSGVELDEAALESVAGGKTDHNVNITGDLNRLLDQVASVWNSGAKGLAKFIYNIKHKC